MASPCLATEGHDLRESCARTRLVANLVALRAVVRRVPRRAAWHAYCALLDVLAQLPRPHFPAVDVAERHRSRSCGGSWRCDSISSPRPRNDEGSQCLGT